MASTGVRLLAIFLLGGVVAFVGFKFLRSNTSAPSTGINENDFLVKHEESEYAGAASNTDGEEGAPAKAERVTPSFKPLELIRTPEFLKETLEQQTPDMKAACSLPYYSMLGKEATFNPDSHRLVASHVIVTPGVTAPDDHAPHDLSRSILEGLDCSYNVSTWQRLLYPPLKELLQFMAVQKTPPNSSIEQHLLDALSPENGRCKFGQLTPTGITQNILVGKYLAHLFVERSGLISENETQKIYLRALDEQATFVGALATGFGFFTRGNLDLRHLKVRPTENQWFCLPRWNMSCNCQPADDMISEVWHTVNRAFQHFNPPDTQRANFARWATVLDKLNVEPHEFMPQLHNAMSHFCAQVQYPCIDHEEEELQQQIDKLSAKSAESQEVKQQTEEKESKKEKAAKKAKAAKKETQETEGEQLKNDSIPEATPAEEPEVKTPTETKPKKCKAQFTQADFRTGFEAYRYLNNDLNTNHFHVAADTLRVFPYLLELISRLDSMEQKLRNNSDDYLKLSITLAKPEFVTALKRTLGINVDGRMTGFASRLSFEVYETLQRNPGELLMRIVENGTPLTLAATKACEKTYQTMCQTFRFRDYIVNRLLVDNVGIADFRRACRLEPARPRQHPEHDL